METLLNFIFYIILGWLVLSLLARWFGPRLFRFVLQRLARKIHKDFAQQNNAYQRKYGDQEIHLDPNLKIKVNQQPSNRNEKLSQAAASAAEDVEFEEIR
jgi:ABC-type uncharacterized transport system fused permease/ATPase subunit